MKSIIYPTIILFITLLSCNKDNSDTNVSGNWELMQKSSSIGPLESVIKPSADSSVLLILNRDNSFVSELNGIVVSQGSYSIQAQPNYPSDLSLQLNNFKTTGIFSLFTLYEIGNNGQVISTYDGFTMRASHDTLSLASVITPGGNESYIFIKE